MLFQGIKYLENTMTIHYQNLIQNLPNLEVSTFANVESSIPPIQRLAQLPIFLSDNLGNP